MAKPVSPRGLARGRVLDCAVALFAECGVHGTSLKMIAQRLGVSKAAVYYQFSSKEEIATEVLRPILEDVTRVIKIAEALPDWEARRAVACSGLVEMAIRHRQLAAVFVGDPAMPLIAPMELRAVTGELRKLLEGPEPDAQSRIAVAVFFAGMGNAVADPLLADIDDDELHGVLLDLSNRIVRPTTDGD
ncbi:TetR/AcrR family transcriptional regulator [Mycobacterium hodleri]|uniref:TetR/AcrR family transcriptional regulator n=1 Tax=Mycolicibacterium hodleri TaxID=49897 RepID=A0A544W888_9MYCO|nr:TetR/AcrR family transcriptional regulator [Mycolicibacterium hodleri]TQR88456.1 TetR/AcrR family transcriptional regulator [Mycolicibacterium hodleri]